MAVFSCVKCSFSYEFTVSNSYKRSIASRMDHCPRCLRTREFRIVALGGMIGKMQRKPDGYPIVSKAALWWRKTHVTGKAIKDPLSDICADDVK